MKKIEVWKKHDVMIWLYEKNLAHLAYKFHLNNIDGVKLMNVQKRDLLSLDIEEHHVQQVLSEIHKLKTSNFKDKHNPSVDAEIFEQMIVLFKEEPLPDSFIGKCDICFEINNNFKLNCKHYLCLECIREFFLESMIHQSLFPPRCCGNNVDLLYSSHSLTKEELLKFKVKYKEYLYEKSHNCIVCKFKVSSKTQKSKVIKCEQCNTIQCKSCKEIKNDFTCMCIDEEDKDIIEFAQCTGWSRCISCGYLIEHISGCRHMTCICGQEFCYTCGNRWRTCGCKLFGN